MIVEHHDAIEEFVFDRGPDNLPYFMCTSLLSVCPPHDLYDHGEL